MRNLLLIVITLFLSGCAQSGYVKFYNPYVDANILPNVERLAKNQEPKVINTNHLDSDILVYRSKNYIPIGHSSFNGPYESPNYAIKQAKMLGATLILITSKYTNTETLTSTLLLPDNKTTYQSGSVSGNTTYNNPYGTYLGNSNTIGNYSGISTTYGTKSIPITTSKKQYDQAAVYFVKSNQKSRIGLIFDDLTPIKRSELQRNTGVIISVVLDDSPAFNSNILVGDVLTKINESNVNNVKGAIKLMGNLMDEKSYKMTFLRNGKVKNILVQL